MTYDEFSRHVGKAGLSLAEYARLVGVQPNSITNYAKKPSMPKAHAIIAVLMGDAADRGVDFKRLLAEFHLLPASPVSRLDEYRRRRAFGDDQQNR